MNILHASNFTRSCEPSIIDNLYALSTICTNYQLHVHFSCINYQPVMMQFTLQYCTHQPIYCTVEMQVISNSRLRMHKMSSNNATLKSTSLQAWNLLLDWTEQPASPLAQVRRTNSVPTYPAYCPDLFQASPLQ